MDLAGIQCEIERLAPDIAGEGARLAAAHLGAVLDRTRILNLTAVTDARDAVRLHVVDSLEVARWLGTLASPMLDIGSGAGFPGIPLAIAGVERVVLLEATGKKAEFLRQVVLDLDLQARIEVESARAEEHGLAAPGRYASIIARAVAPLAALVELASPLLRPEGIFIAMKGEPSGEERRAGAAAAGIVGLVESHVERYTLPGSNEKRTLVVYRKIADSSVPLPRRTGMAQKRPLA